MRSEDEDQRGYVSGRASTSGRHNLKELTYHSSCLSDMRTPVRFRKIYLRNRKIMTSNVHIYLADNTPGLNNYNISKLLKPGDKLEIR